MTQTKYGALKRMSNTAGLSVEEFSSHLEKDQKWCLACRTWHKLEEFGLDSNRTDGRVPSCKKSRNEYARIRYNPKTHPNRGRRFIPARDGDKRQAKARINYFVDSHLIPDPNSLSCANCGHGWKIGERRHEYHHYLGYAAENHEKVIVLCSKCHHRDAIDRNEWKPFTGLRTSNKTHCSKGHKMSRGADGNWRCHECRLEYWRKYNKGKRINGNST
jgi:hypothetical protein